MPRLLLPAFVICWLWPAAPTIAEIRSIILFIADGWGFNHVAATRFWQGEEQAYETFPVKLAMSTYSWSTLQEDFAGYDPQRANSDWDYLLRNPGESASAASAMSTGRKGRAGQLNVDAATGDALPTIFERAEALGKSTGIVTSVQWSHGTPAGFAAHDTSRRSYEAIAREMLDSSGCEVIMGCGHPLFDPQGNPTDRTVFKYTGGRETWETLAGGAAAFAFVQTRAEFLRLIDGDTPPRVCGTAQVRGTLQQQRAPEAEKGSLSPPFSTPPLRTVPALAEMTAAALNVLDDNPQGFLLMVEAGAIDWAAHNHQLGRMIEEMLALNDAVQTALDWMDRADTRDGTLIIVTGDHETGYLWGPGSGPPATWNRVIDNGPGELPGARFYSESHTNSLVPFFASGPAAGFDTLAARRDPRYGPYLDNTDIAKAISRLWP